MTKAELIKALKACKSYDKESDHSDADQLLLKFIGDKGVTKAYEAVEKWHA